MYDHRSKDIVGDADYITDQLLSEIPKHEDGGWLDDDRNDDQF